MVGILICFLAIFMLVAAFRCFEQERECLYWLLGCLLIVAATLCFIVGMIGALSEVQRQGWF